jgi:hypothetical protein
MLQSLSTFQLLVWAFGVWLVAVNQTGMASASAEATVGPNSQRLPPISLRHLERLTDRTGIHEFAHGTVPWHENGYCAEDVARALVAVTLAERVTGRPEGRSLARTYLAYLEQSARPDGQIWNRRDKTLAEGDSYGRVLWGLGYAASFHPDREIAQPASQLFLRLLPRCEARLGPYPIARAYAVQGMAAFLAGNTNAAVLAALRRCAEANLAAFRRQSTANWKWFDATMTYDTGRLTIAMLLASEATGDANYRAAGLDSLHFLLATCFTNDSTMLTPVGNKGWFKQGGVPALFDQQPIDAASVVEACCLARHMTGDGRYAALARVAFDWFLGNNLRHAAMYDAMSDGCYDGLTEAGPNLNEGGESTIMYLIARCTLEELLKGKRHE